MKIDEDDDDGKVQPGISVKRERWRQFKKEAGHGKASKEIEAFMKDYIKKGDTKLERLKHEMQEKTQELKELEAKHSEVQAEISGIEASINRIRQKSESSNQDIDRFLNVFSEKYIDTENPDAYDGKSEWAKPDHINIYWKDSICMEKNKLWQKGIKHIQK